MSQQRSNLLQTIVLAVIALVVLVPLGIISVILVDQGHSSEVIAFLGPLAGAVVAFFFQHGTSFLAQAGAADQRRDLLDFAAGQMVSPSAAPPSSPPAPTATPMATSGTSTPMESGGSAGAASG